MSTQKVWIVPVLLQIAADSADDAEDIVAKVAEDAATIIGASGHKIKVAYLNNLYEEAERADYDIDANGRFVEMTGES